jgi:hypothetical protein
VRFHDAEALPVGEQGYFFPRQDKRPVSGVGGSVVSVGTGSVISGVGSSVTVSVGSATGFAGFRVRLVMFVPPVDAESPARQRERGHLGLA